MLGNCKVHRLACVIIPSFSIITLLFLSLSQNRLSTEKRPVVCKPCNCEPPQLLNLVEDSSFPSKSSLPIKPDLPNCPCKRKKVKLMYDMPRPNITEFETGPDCSQCNPLYENIDINVNRREKTTGLYDKRIQSIYIPFDFLQKHYELYSDFKPPSRKVAGSLLWLSTNLREGDVSRYQTFGRYMNMENSSVENRERVKLISAPEGVPVSTQWSKLGYYYPTQVAQFGLSHFSKHLRFPKPTVYLIEDGTLNVTDRWIVQEGASMRSVFDRSVGSRIVFFDSRGIQEDGITFPVSIAEGKMCVLSLSIKFRSVGQVSVAVLASDNEHYVIRYVVSESMWVKYSHPEIYYGLRKRGRWFHLTRDLNVDLQKGLGSTQGKKVKVVTTTVVQVVQFTFHGTGWFDNVTLSSSAHERLFLTAANWFVKNQDGHGGWPINVTRKVNEGLQIRPGWYSAMSQGQAISLLCRAYNHTKNRAFLRTAIAALKIFRRSSSKPGGIVARFMDKYDWYEEYPTQPPMFVLNGFMYSLLGLYDLTVATKGSGGGKEAQSLLNAGLTSLEAMLPLFDNGFGTFYDLRHISLNDGQRPPNRARWSYHILHVEQLSVIRQFFKSTKVDNVMRRWKKYIRGYVAPHN